MKKSIIFALICIVLFTLLTGCEAKEEIFEEEIPVTVNDLSSMRQTVIYYPNQDGYIVPIMKYLSWGDTMLNDAMDQMRRDAVAEMGAEGVLPVFNQEANYNISIKDGVATVDLTNGSLACTNEKEEINEVISIVNTLCGFDNVDKVEFTVNGKPLRKLKYGTNVKGQFSEFDLNPQSSDKKIDMTTAAKAVLYYPLANYGSEIVPVTLYYSESIGVEQAVADLLTKQQDTTLVNPFPEGTELLWCNVSENNVATLNFSENFLAIENNADKGETALKAIYLTCLGFDNVNDVAILVNDEEFNGAVNTMAMSKYPNTR